MEESSMRTIFAGLLCLQFILCTQALGHQKVVVVPLKAGAGIPVVTSAGQVWMAYNLGADRVAASFDDPAAFGAYFQWGRLADGHEYPTSPTTSTLSSSDVPGHHDFILSTSTPYDWRTPQKNTLWQGAAGKNNPCPAGFRLPTQAEWETERLSWSSADTAGAFASPLKLVAAGYRARANGTIELAGSYGYYWSSSVDGSWVRVLNVTGTTANFYNSSRADGFNIRCIKD